MFYQSPFHQKNNTKSVIDELGCALTTIRRLASQGILPILISMFLSNCNDRSKFITNKNKSTIEKTQLFIEDIHGKYQVISVDPKLFTVQSLKEKIQDFCGVPPQDQSIVFGRTILRNDKDFLYDYGIASPLELITVLLKIRGGNQPGPELESEPTETKLVSRKDLPEWTTVGDGFNIIITCPNKKCPSHSYNYFNHIHIGVKGMFLFDEVMDDGITCIACRQKTHDGSVVKSFMFLDAAYTIYGRHTGKNEYGRFKDSQKVDIKGKSENRIAKKYSSKDWVFWNGLRVTI